MPKLCSTCNQIKTLYYQGTCKDGLSHQCTDCTKKSFKIYRKKNAKKYMEHSKRWAKDNREKYLKGMKEFRLRNYAAAKYRSLLRNAASRDISVAISRDTFIEWYESEEKKCIYCDISEQDALNKYKCRLETDRKINSVGYCKENIVLACHLCNTSKTNFFTFEEWKEIAQKYIKPRLAVGIF